MSHSSSATIASTTQPLSDILPWGPPISVSPSSAHHGTSNDSPGSRRSNHTTANADMRTLVVTDACSTDGRFLLHTLALQFLSSRYSMSSSLQASPKIMNDAGNNNSNNSSLLEGAVLWISCAPVSEKQIMMGLRKALQHNLGGSSSVGVGSASTSGRMGGKTSSGVGSSSSSFGQQGGIGNISGRIHIVSIPLELADAALEKENNTDGINTDEARRSSFSHESYLKQLHKRIVHWLYHRELMSMQQSEQQQHNTLGRDTLGPNIVIIDNVTALETIFGSILTNAFVCSVRSSLRKYAKKCCSSSNSNTAIASDVKTNPAVTTTNLFALRVSSPDDGGLYQFDDGENMKGEKLRSEYARLLRPWLGFGSGMSPTSSNNDGAVTDILQMEEQSNYISLSPHSPPSILYRSGLYEIADGIVDVSPLESGYARDVLGRLSFVTPWSGKGWWGVAGTAAGGGGVVSKQDSSTNGSYASICVNYRCDDSGVRVMRLRTR
eukprot:CAMPEP_0183732008 /NCGR_PEP_ID=MMETSP0737-20130205/37179_1 /TAXON_ID=385413 /ORGANISM="Thalassiosira miniscula, Strain CCMP1093" /LENGTH=493 /DNA_ID=CAMNT_0025964889 /DNA_START=5 /DNA_END=1486 /DNA_ORIENTATION=-